MKVTCGIVAIIAVLSAGPAGAVDLTGGGYTNIWSSGQGTAYSYGNALANSGSAAQSLAVGGGGNLGTLGNLGGVISSSSSFANTSSNGSGYAQAQSSGYAGGSAGSTATRSH